VAPRTLNHPPFIPTVVTQWNQWVTVHFSRVIWYSVENPLKRWAFRSTSIWHYPISSHYASNFIRFELPIPVLIRTVRYDGSPPVVKSVDPQPLSAFQVELPLP